MFQNFANYLLGSVTNQEQDRATAEGVEAIHNSNAANSRLRSAESEDDWVLVDRDSEGNSEASSVESLDINEDENEDRIEPLPNITRTSSTSSLPCANMEESWFLTPPPCFTSAGPVMLETSPLENLLIEHPSMSVYVSHLPRRHGGAAGAFYGATLRADSPAPAADEDFEVEEVEEEQVTLVHRRQPRVNREQVLQQQEKQKIKSKHAQKVQMQKACQAIKRGHLDRNNKAREVNSRNRRQRRGERSQGANRSHANNNRKC
ncbi:unnamed protein product [Brassicogethes aeneus]|uniref:Tumor protein p53-inducible nuclear protein 1 n=1 Tax=Brassicogethes aeneus TaxID=1431903 RepID=A0A9P0ASX1_BRAAE|nr:unnamed protein product [Brassicogethes aeneus]